MSHHVVCPAIVIEPQPLFTIPKVPLEEKNILTVRKEEEEEDDNDGHAEDVEYSKGDSVLVGPCDFLVGFGLVMLFCDSAA
ncbi:hypothetical protein RIF29_10520 [Crotalaria pallida]|uniref:Uncharacterized protein n=1 Tax=Crotalaria pallida TaxID=3830 RepID=A0AAN9FVU1_CROPI